LFRAGIQFDASNQFHVVKYDTFVRVHQVIGEKALSSHRTSLWMSSRKDS
jgi:hypothetical protein